MNKFIYSNIKISPIYGLSMLRKHINKGITELSVENIFNRYKEIELEKKKFVSSKKSNKNLQTIIKLSDEIVNTNKFQLNLLNKNQFNLSLYKSKFLILHYNKLEKLVNLLSKLFKKSVELELIRIYSPKNESNILANLIGILSNFIKFRYIHIKLFNKNKIPSFLSGIYLKLAGRVLTQKIQRRVKSKVVQKGSLARTKANLVNTNRFVNKKKKNIYKYINYIIYFNKIIN